MEASRTERMLTVAEVADALNITERMVRRLISDGQLKVHRFGRHVRVSEGDLADYVSRSRTNTSSTSPDARPRRRP